MLRSGTRNTQTGKPLVKPEPEQTDDEKHHRKTGQDAELNVLAGYTLSAEAGILAITGQDAQLVADRILAADPGALAITGQAATLSYSGEVIITPDIIIVPGEIQRTLSVSGEIQRTIEVKGELS